MFFKAERKLQITSQSFSLVIIVNFTSNGTVAMVRRESERNKVTKESDFILIHEDDAKPVAIFMFYDCMHLKYFRQIRHFTYIDILCRISFFISKIVKF